MKIAIAIQDLNMRGGTHKQVLRLSQYLKKNGHDITIISKYVDLDKTYGDFQDFTIISGTKRLARPRQKIIRNVLSLIASWKLARRVASDFDVLNIHDSGFGHHAPEQGDIECIDGGVMGFFGDFRQLLIF